MRRQKDPFTHFCEISQQLLAGDLQQFNNWRIIYSRTQDDAELRTKIHAYLAALQGRDAIFDSLVQLFVNCDPKAAIKTLNGVLVQETPKIGAIENTQALVSAYLDNNPLEKIPHLTILEKRTRLKIFGEQLKLSRGPLTAYSNAHFLRGWIYQYHERNFDKAHEFYLAAGTPEKQNANALCALASMYEYRRIYATEEEAENFAAQAQMFFKIAIEELEYPEAMNSYGMTLDDQDPKKEQLIRQASEHGYLYAHYNLAVLLRRKDPNSHEAKSLLAIAERFGMRQELWSQAQVFMQRAQDLKSINPRLAELSTQRALDRLRGMLCLNPLKSLQTLADLPTGLTKHLQLEKKPAQALYHADLLLKKDPNNVYAREQIHNLFAAGPETSLGQRYFDLVWPEIMANAWSPSELVLERLAQRMENNPEHSSSSISLKQIVAKKIGAGASPRLKHELITRILNQEASGLTSFFWTQRGLAEPTAEAGSLKLLSEILARTNDDQGIELEALLPTASEVITADSPKLCRAKKAFDEGNYGCALYFYERAIHNDPSQIDVDFHTALTGKIILDQSLGQLGDSVSQLYSYIIPSIHALLRDDWHPLDTTILLLANEKEQFLNTILDLKESPRCNLLNAALNPATHLGRVFWQQRGSNPCSLGTGQLARIQAELARIEASHRDSGQDIELRRLAPGAK